MHAHLFNGAEKFSNQARHFIQTGVNGIQLFVHQLTEHELLAMDVRGHPYPRRPRTGSRTKSNTRISGAGSPGRA